MRDDETEKYHDIRAKAATAMLKAQVALDGLLRYSAMADDGRIHVSRRKDTDGEVFAHIQAKIDRMQAMMHGYSIRTGWPVK